LAAIPNVTLLEAPWGNRDAEMNICWPYPEIVDGYALLLEGPGLGIQFDEELAASKLFVPSLQPWLNALDGAVRDFWAFASKARRKVRGCI
jgi:galactonate dehydratase